MLLLSEQYCDIFFFFFLIADIPSVIYNMG